jgi:hypothetical protein
VLDIVRVLAHRVGYIEAERLEQDIQLTRRAERREQAGGVEAVRAEVTEDGPAIIEQGLDVHRLQRPVALLDDALAGGEAARAVEVGLAGAIEVVRPGGAEHQPRLGLRRRLARAQLDQHLTQLGPSV